MKLEPHDLALVVGIRGAGKSYWASRHIVREASRVLVWDPHAEHASAGHVTSVTLDELTPETLDASDLRIAVVPDYRTLSELAEEFGYLIDVLSMCEGFTVVIDEVGLLKRATEHVEYLATQSRHWKMPLALIAQRAVQIPPTARDQASKIVSFRQLRPEDIAALADRIGERAEGIQRLPRRECLTWTEEEAFNKEATR